MNESSQMTIISNLNLENFSPDMSFQITFDDIKKNDNENINNISIDLISNDIKTILKKDLPDNVIDLTQCFICLSIVSHPLSCPKCNNFACKKCFENYFGNQLTKNCPLCKQSINKKDLKKNKTMREIEKIIYKEDTKKNKINELTKLVDEKKKIWENQGTYVSNLIETVLRYQENLKEYRKQYELFIISWKEKIKKIFDNYEKKLEDLIELLINYKKKYTDDFKLSIIKFNKIKEDNTFTKKDIYSLVNEILTMERRHFNEEIKKNISPKDKFNFSQIIKLSKEFFIMPILIMPNISVYNIETNYIGKKDLKKGYIKKKDYNVHVGYYQIQYIFDVNKYNALCKLYIKNDKEISIITVQKKVIENKSYEIIPMKDISDYTHYIYETNLDLNELRDDNKTNIRFETKVQIFNVIV